MLTTEYDVKIADFGASKLIKTEKNSLTPKQGSIAYQSPEIKTGSDYDYKTDVW